MVCIRLGKLLRMPKPTTDIQTTRKTQITDGLKVESNCANQFNKGKVITATNHHLPPSTDVADEQSPDGEGMHDGDWKYAALVIDRLCFYVCTLYLTTITVAFYACAIANRS